MLVTQKSIIFHNLSPLIFVNRNGKTLAKNRNPRRFGTISAEKRDLSENSETQQQNVFQLSVSNTILARSAVAVLGLGFIDAGYSGDWSRIGVISRETEEVLKIAAFVVVPFCVFLIFSLSKEQET